MRPPIVAALAALSLSACAGPDPNPGIAGVLAGPAPDRINASNAVANFRLAASRVAPAAESVCRERAPGIDCDFLIRVDPDPDAPPNGFQSLGARGRPVLTFTAALIADTRNVDEIAFVIGHESAHHIEQHIARQRTLARAGAAIGRLIGVVIGGSRTVIAEYAANGATFGQRVNSKTDELEADALGTIITQRAGFDPVRGAAFFSRIPDPGDRFLGTHPPNAARIEIVRRTAAGL